MGWYEKKETPKPTVNEYFIDARIKQYNTRWRMKSWLEFWNTAHVQRNKDYLRPGEAKITKEKFPKTFWNKQSEEGWRMDLDSVNIEVY
jgi:hypothetical protein